MHHITVLCDRYRTDTKVSSTDFFDTLAAYDWPGKIRELNQALERALPSAGPNPMLFPIDLPDEIRAKVVRKTFTVAELQPSAIGEDGVIDPSAPLSVLKDVRARMVENFKKQYLEILLKPREQRLRSAPLRSSA